MLGESESWGKGIAGESHDLAAMVATACAVVRLLLVVDGSVGEGTWRIRGLLVSNNVDEALA